LSEAEPNEVVEHPEEDGQDDEEDDHQYEVRRLGREVRRGVAFEEVSAIASQIPTQIAIKGFWGQLRQKLMTSQKLAFLLSRH